MIMLSRKNPLLLSQKILYRSVRVLAVLVAVYIAILMMLAAGTVKQSDADIPYGAAMLAHMGHQETQYQLGLIYHIRYVAPEIDTTSSQQHAKKYAAYWYDRAARNGHQPAKDMYVFLMSETIK